MNSPCKVLKFGYELQLRYEPFFLDCHPDQECAKLPNLFNQEHAHELASSVFLCDPAGNMFQVLVEIQNGEVFFVKGWNTIVKYYRVMLGGWARLVYIRPDRFMLKMRDRVDQEVMYPAPGKLVWVDQAPQSINVPHQGGIPDQVLTICQKPDLFHVLEKTLTFADVWSGRLHIPNDFCVVAFRKSDVRVVLYDDYGVHTSCFLQFRNDAPGYCGISDGWYRYCHLKGLKPGQLLHLAVATSNPTMLNLSVIKD